MDIFTVFAVKNKRKKNCPRCGNVNRCKDGIVKGRQRYECKDCKYHYTEEQRSNEKSQQTKRLAIEMYLEGIGFRVIGRVLKISYVTVFQWINQLGQNMELPKRQEGIAVVELDEMHTYVGLKKLSMDMDCC
ncbi:MAG: IS1 family transposase [Bacteroidales bacterium]|jgi:transposase-like protein|nr:IS1 family transposase [Bacteroidales bacterium]